MTSAIDPFTSTAVVLFEIYQHIQDIFDNPTDPTEKWFEIATIMDRESGVFRKIFKLIKKQTDRKAIKLEYDIPYKTIKNTIKAESNVLVRTSLVITALHHIVYTLISASKNHHMSFDGQTEIKVLEKPVTYYLIMSVKTEQNIYFHAFIMVFGLESLFNKHFYIGIDFEYTRKKIKLAQMNFEHNVESRNIITFTNPDELTEPMMSNMIYMIMCNKYIRKILHGSDSLDILYVYGQMLEDDPKKVRRFTRTLIDTRFLCEYYKLNKPGEEDNKCRVYDEDPAKSAIYYFGVITDERQENLTRVMDDLPPTHDIEWNIHKMHDSQVLYAMYDVLYLKYFYRQIIRMAASDEKTDSDKQDVILVYKHIMYEFTQFSYMEKRGYTMLTTKCKEEVDPVNNYMIRKGNDILKLIDIYKDASTEIQTVNPKVNLDKLANVSYYKGLLSTLVKKIIYTVVSRTCKVYQNRNVVWTDKLSNLYVFDFLKEMQYEHLHRLFKSVEQIIEDRVKKICSGPKY